MRILVIGVAMLALGAISCGSDSDLCSHLSSTAASIQTKGEDCGSPISVDGSTADCEAHLGNCNDNDKTLLNNYLTCLDALPTCTTATETDWESQADACSSPLSGLSAACSAGSPDAGT